MSLMPNAGWFLHWAFYFPSLAIPVGMRLRGKAWFEVLSLMKWLSANEPAKVADVAI